MSFSSAAASATRVAVGKTTRAIVVASKDRFSSQVLSLGILGFGLTVGAIDQLLLNRQGPGIEWTMALVAGFTGSFVGGMHFSLNAGDGCKLRLCGSALSLVQSSSPTSGKA